MHLETGLQLDFLSILKANINNKEFSWIKMVDPCVTWLTVNFHRGIKI